MTEIPLLSGIPHFNVLMVAKQFGFTNGAGSIQNIVDKDLTTFYQPLASDFSTYTDQFLLADGTLNYGKPFAAIEIHGIISDADPVVPQHITSMKFDLETVLTLGACVIVGSNNPATSVSDTLQLGDVLLASFTAGEVTSGKVLALPAMQAGVANYTYYRILQRSTKAADAPPNPNIGSNFRIFDTQGSLSFVVPAYSGTFTIELWGGGSTGGENALGVSGTASTCTAYGLSAGGGNHATQTAPNADAAGATGGTATGGNTLNINGGAGHAPSPASVGEGFSGAGGDAPNGGKGGDPVGNAFNGLKLGLPGQAPGGGGSGRNIASSIAGGSYFKYPGGGSGGYVKHVLTLGSGGPAVGSTITFIVGAGGLSVNKDTNGDGANGRAKFSWT